VEGGREGAGGQGGVVSGCNYMEQVQGGTSVTGAGPMAQGEWVKASVDGAAGGGYL
jgi:hypothetical protein